MSNITPTELHIVYKFIINITKVPANERKK